MKIHPEKCVGCYSCIPYCPVAAIKKNEEGVFPTATIDQDECVECGVCLRSGTCKTGALYWPDLQWPRAVRQAFSAVLIGYDIFQKVGILGYREGEAGVGGGRGTSEMKTNDVTGRYREGEVGIGAEMGRPCQGFYFRDMEKVTTALAKLGVEFEWENPLTVLMDPKTGVFKHREIMNEKAMSAIIEMNVKEERLQEVIDTLKKAAKEIDTVITVDIIHKCKDGKITIGPLLEKSGIKVRINGKANIGLGRPLIA